MGPSGSGKTTLLNHLACRRVTGGGSSQSGRVMFNGAVQSLSTIRDITAYVEQEDALIGTLTAEETLQFAARLALPRSVTSATMTTQVYAPMLIIALQLG